jgi:hypothetical protein
VHTTPPVRLVHPLPGRSGSPAGGGGGGGGLSLAAVASPKVVPPSQPTTPARRVDETDVAAVVYALNDPGLRAGDVKHHLRSIVALTFNSPDNALRACHAGAVAALVGALQRHYGASDVAERACWALQCVASHSEEGRVRCAAEGAVEAVLAALDTHVGAAPVVQRACSVLAVLCAVQEVRDAAQRAEAARRTVAAMALHARDAGVQERACTFIAALGECPEAALDATRQGAIAAIVSALKTHKDSPGLAHKAAAALLALTGPMECKLLAVAAGAIEAVVGALRGLGTSHAGLAETGTRALACMACADATRGRAMTAGVPALVVSLMAAHAAAPGVAEQGCGALATCADAPDTRAGVVIRSAVPAVCEAMVTHGDVVVGVAESGAWALQTLVADAATTFEASDLFSAAQAAIFVLRAHASHPGVCTQACALLAALATAPGDTTATVALHYGGLDAVAASLRLLIDDVTAAEQACGALRALLPDAACRAAAAAAGCIVYVCNCLRAHSEQAHIQVRGLAALEALVSGPSGEVDEANAAEAVGAGGAVCCVSAMAAHPNDSDIAAVAVATLGALDLASGGVDMAAGGAETPVDQNLGGRVTPDADTFRAAARAARVRRRARGDGSVRSGTSMSSSTLTGGSEFNTPTPSGTRSDPHLGERTPVPDYGDAAFAAAHGAGSMAAGVMSTVPREGDEATSMSSRRSATPGAASKYSYMSSSKASYTSRASTPAASDVSRATDVVAVTSTLRSHPDAPAVATAACAALARLSAVSDAHAAKAVHAGACEAVLRAMTTQPTNASLAEAACMALGALLSDGASRRRALGAGAMDCVLASLSRLATHNVGVAEHACSALQALCTSSDGCVAALSAGALDSIISCALDAHPHEPRVADAACGALAFLATSHEDARDAAVVAGAIRGAVATLNRCMHGLTTSVASARAGAQEGAAQLLAALCVGDAALVAADACGAPEALCDTLMAMPAPTPTLAIACCAALRALATAPWLRVRLHACGAPAACGVATRVVSAATHSPQADAARAGGRGMHAPGGITSASVDAILETLMALLPPGMPAAVTTGAGSASLGAWVAVLSLYAPCPDVVVPILGALLPRTATRQERAAFAAAGGVEAVRSVMFSHAATNEDIARDAAMLLSNLGVSSTDPGGVKAPQAVLFNLIQAIGDGADAAQTALAAPTSPVAGGSSAVTAPVRKHLWDLVLRLCSRDTGAGGEQVLHWLLEAQAPAAVVSALAATTASRDVDGCALASWCVALMARRSSATSPSAAARLLLEVGAVEACLHAIEVLPAAPPLTERVADALHAMFQAPGNVGLTARSRGAAASAHEALLMCCGRHAGHAAVCAAAMGAAGVLMTRDTVDTPPTSPRGSPSRETSQGLKEVVSRLHVESTLSLAQAQAAPGLVAAAAAVLSRHGSSTAHGACVAAAATALAAIVAPLSGSAKEVLPDVVADAFETTRAVEALVLALSAVRSRPVASAACCKCVSSLCADLGLCHALCASGGVNTVVAVLEAHPDEQRVQDAGFWALHALRVESGTVTPDSYLLSNNAANAAPKLGGPRAAIDAVAAHPDSPPVSERVCAALAQYTAMTPEEATAAMDTALTCIVRHGAKHPRVAAFGLAALAAAATSTPAVKDAIVAAGGCELAHGCLANHKAHPLVAEHACGALGVLASNEDYAPDEVIYTAIRAVVASMRAFPTQWRVSTAGCAALRALCVDDPCKEAALEAGAPELVLATLRSHGSKAPACAAACAASLALALLPAAARRLASLGAIPGVVAAMRIHSAQDAVVAERACSALTAFAMHGDLRARVIGAGAAMASCDALMSHRQQARVADAALRCLLAMAVETSMRMRLADARAPDAASQALSWHAASNLSVCDHGTALLAALATDDACRARCAAAGAVPALHAVLRSPAAKSHVTIAERASSAISILAGGGEELAWMVGADGGARVLVDTMRAHATSPAVQAGCIAALLHCTLGAGLPPIHDGPDGPPLASVSQLDALRSALLAYVASQDSLPGGADDLVLTAADIEAVVAAAARALRVRLYNQNGGLVAAAQGDDSTITAAARALVMATVAAGEAPPEAMTGDVARSTSAMASTRTGSAPSTRPASAASSAHNARSGASSRNAHSTGAPSATSSGRSSRAASSRSVTPLPESGEPGEEWEEAGEDGSRPSSALTVVTGSDAYSRGASPVFMPDGASSAEQQLASSMGLAALLARNAAADREVLAVAAAAMADVVAALSGSRAAHGGEASAASESAAKASVAHIVQEGASKVVAAMRVHAQTVNSNFTDFTTQSVADVMNAAAFAFGQAPQAPMTGAQQQQGQPLGLPGTAPQLDGSSPMPPSPRDAAAAAMSQIVDALLTRTSQSSLAERGARALANYIALDSNREEALTAGMVSCLAAALMKHSEDAHVSARAAWALVTLVDSGGDNATRAVQCGACMAALGILRAHPRNAGVAEQALRCARALAVVPAGLEELMAASGHRDSLRALHFLGNASPGVAAAAAALLAVTWPDDEDEALTSAAAMVCANVVGVHAQDWAVASGLAALIRVAAVSPKAAALGGAFVCALEACAAHAKDPVVILRSATLLVAVIPHMDEETTIAQVELAMGAIVKGLRDNGKNDPDVAAACLTAIALLAKISGQAAQFACTLGVTDLALNMCKAHGEQSAVATAAVCHVFASLAQSGLDSCIVRVTSCSGVEVACDALRSHPDSVDVAIKACSALEALTRNTEPNKRRAIAASGLELAVAATVMHASDAQAAAAACGAVRSLSWHPTSRIAAASAGAVEALVAVILVHEMVPAVLDAAAGALGELVVNDVNKQRASKMGAVEALVHGLRAHGGDQPAMVATCAATLATLSVDDSAARRATDEAALNALVACVVAHREVPTTLGPCLWALSNLCSSGDTQICHKALRLNALSSAAAALASHGQAYPEVARHAAQLIAALARCPIVDDRKSTGPQAAASTVAATLGYLRSAVAVPQPQEATAETTRSVMAALTALSAWPGMRAAFQDSGAPQVALDTLNQVVRATLASTTQPSGDALAGLAQDAAAALQALCVGPDGSALAPPQGAVESLVVALSLSASAPVAAAAAGALHVLGLHPDARSEAVSSNACDALLAAARRHSVGSGSGEAWKETSYLVVSRSFGALAALCDLDPAMRESAMHSGGVHACVGALMACVPTDQSPSRPGSRASPLPSSHQGVESLSQKERDALYSRTEQCLRFLHSLSGSSDACTQALAAGALPACCGCLRHHVQSASVVIWTSKVIARLCASAQLAGAGDAPAAVVSAMQLHSAKGSVLAAGSLALAALAAVDEHAEMVAVAGGVEALVAAVWGNTHDEEVITSASVALTALCRSSASRRRAADSGAAEALVTCVSTPGVAPAAAAQAITALLALASGGAAMPAVAARLRAVGALPSCMALLTMTPTPPVASCAAALAAVAQLLSMPGGGDAEAGIMPQAAGAACTVLAVCGAAPEVAAAGCDVLRVCASNITVPKQAIQTAACAGFQHPLDARVQVAALSALAALRPPHEGPADGTATLLRRAGVGVLIAAALDEFPYDNAVRAAADAAGRSAGSPHSGDGVCWNREEALEAAEVARAGVLASQQAALQAVVEAAAASDARAFAARYEEFGRQEGGGSQGTRP